MKRSKAVAILALLALASPIGLDAAKVRDGQPHTRTVAILIFDGVQIIDFSAPWEVLGQAGFLRDGEYFDAFDIYSIAKSRAPVTTAMGMTVTPKYRFGEGPKPDIVLVPGGGGSSPGDPGVGTVLRDPAVIDWIRQVSAESEIVMSVCNGAFLLAAAGLLRNQRATTFHGALDQLAEFSPTTEVVRDARFVDNGRVITTAGLSSGVDGSLHLIERLYGRHTANLVALHIEYDWRPASGYARGAFADRFLYPLSMAPPDGVEWIIVRYEGGRSEWVQHNLVLDPIDRDQLADELATRIDAAGGHRFGSAAEKGAMEWRFDGEGDLWTGRIEIELPSTEQGAWLVRFRVSQDPIGDESK